MTVTTTKKMVLTSTEDMALESTAETMALKSKKKMNLYTDDGQVTIHAHGTGDGTNGKMQLWSKAEMALESDKAMILKSAKKMDLAALDGFMTVTTTKKMVLTSTEDVALES